MTRADAATGNRKRHLYTITDEGRQVLGEWLAQPAEPRVVRNEMLLKMFFGRHIERDVLRQQLQIEVQRARGALQGAAGAMAWLQETEADAPDLGYWLLTLDLGRRSAQARAEWAEASLRKLEREDWT